MKTDTIIRSIEKMPGQSSYRECHNSTYAMQEIKTLKEQLGDEN